MKGNTLFLFDPPLNNLAERWNLYILEIIYVHMVHGVCEYYWKEMQIYKKKTHTFKVIYKYKNILDKNMCRKKVPGKS